jgi:PadR family transcriptional regulator
MPSNRPAIDFIELHILHHASQGELYGLWMIEELAEHGYRLNASQLYPRFHRLEREALLTRREKVVDGRRRKYYRITREGRTYFAEQRRRLVELISEALSPAELEQALKQRRRRDRRHRTKDDAKRRT